jgi:glycine oxidase
MTRPSQKTIIIAGGGAIGATCALVLASKGHAVSLIDPATLGQNTSGHNTSGMAAGMLAPAFEAVMDGSGRAVFDLYLESQKGWDPLLAELGLAQVAAPPSGAVWLGEDVEAMAGRFEALGADYRLITAKAAQALSPGLAAGAVDALVAPQDGRLDPLATLARLYAAGARRGVQYHQARLTQYAAGRAVLDDGQVMQADHLVVAAGLPRALAGLAPELAHLVPIKGQLVHFDGQGPSIGPSLRTRLGYATPTGRGLAIGATMEAGLDDTDLDAQVAERLGALGRRLFPGLEGHLPTARAGVRAASPDGLPLVGPSQAPGVILACGMRRNGWLLAPLVAAQVAAYVQSEQVAPWAAVLSPQRFDSV